MKHIPAIKAVMTPFPYSIDADAPANTALATMEEHGISHLPVMRNGSLVGIISHRAVRSAAGSAISTDSDTNLKVRDIYQSDPYVVDLNERLDKVLIGMSDRQEDMVLITRNGRLAGVFTNSDACRSYAALLRQMALDTGGDDAA